VLQGKQRKVLQRRGKIYTSRVVVPVDLQPLLHRVEITRSLRTSERRKALRRLGLWEAHVGLLMTTIRLQGTGMMREQLDQLVNKYLSKTFEQIEDRLAMEWSEVSQDVHQGDLCEEAERLSAGLSRIDYSLGLGEALKLLPGAQEETLRTLARRLMEAKLEVIKAELKALSGEPLRMPVMRPVDHQPPKAHEQVTPTLRLSEVASRYAEERVARNNWTPRSALQYGGIHAVIVDLLGDPEVARVTKANMRQLGLDLTKYPANAQKRFPGFSPKDVLAAAEEAEITKPIPRLAPNSVNMYQQAARSLFKWAEENDYISKSPAGVMRYVDTGLAEEDRDPFDDNDLRAYFEKLDEETEPYMYWIPRILAFSGCRLGEVAQLEKADVRQDQGIWVFDINASKPLKRLKNKYSKRLVPVHPRLIELGLLDFVRDRADGFLWPAEIRTNELARSSIDKLQRRLAYRLRAAGVTHPRKTAAHSFRHTVSDRLQAVNVQGYMISQILGHKNSDMSTGRYGGKGQTPMLLEALSKLTLPI